MKISSFWWRSISAVGLFGPAAGFVYADADSLVHLRLDEGAGVVAVDSSGMGNDGALVNGPVYEADTADGSAYAVRFDGDDDYIDLGPLDVNGGGLTLAAWFKADRYTGPSRDPRLISKGTGVQDEDHVFMLSTIASGSATRLRARLRVDGSTTTLIASSGNLETDVWQHGAVTYDGTALRLYLNGVEVGSTALSGTIDTDPGVPVTVGAQPPGAGRRFFDGLIDDVRILQRALDAEEIAALLDPNTAPAAADDAYSTPQDTQLAVTASAGVLANDTDEDGDSLEALLVTDAANGTLTLNADGSFIYIPDSGFTGEDTFTYRATDGSLDSGAATVTIDVVSADSGSVVVLSLDEGAGVVAVDSSGMGNNGALVNGPVYEADTADGSAYAVRFDGEDDYIDLGPLDVNRSGLTLAAWFKADHYTGPSRDPRLISKGTGVQDEDHVFMLSTIASGSATRLRARLRVDGVTTTLIASSGNLEADVWQHAAVTYDGTALRLYLNGVEVGSTALSGTIDIDPGVPVTVGAQPPGAGRRFFDGLIDDVRILQRALDAEEIAALLGSNTAPVAADDAYSTPQDMQLAVSDSAGVLANDTDEDGDSLEALLVTDAANGTLTLNADGSFVYVPDSGFTGTDSFTYRTTDGSLDSGTATVTIDVEAVAALPPIAEDDQYVTSEDTLLSITSSAGVLSNDMDRNPPDDLTASLETGTASGSITLATDGSFTYAPEPDFNGIDSFVYRVTDAATGGSAVAAAEISVDAVNDPPIAASDTYTTPKNSELIVDVIDGVLANDGDVDGDTLQAFLVSDVANGSLLLNSDGSFQYLPNADFAGADSFTYRASDGLVMSGTTTVTLRVEDAFERVSDGLILFYGFEEGAGGVVTDTSGFGQPLDLAITDPASVTWTDGGLRIDDATIIDAAQPPEKVYTAARASDALTVEAWISSSDLAQNGPARIVTLSADALERNLTLGQGVHRAGSDRFEIRLRTTSTDPNGEPAVDTPPGSLSSGLHHVVYARDAAGQATVWIDGNEQETATVPGDLSNWNDLYRLALANELTLDRPWLGEYQLVAFYDRALSGEEVRQNYEAGPNEDGALPGLGPTARFTATPSSGDAPLNVVLDATSSTDPDGTIVDYLWDLGDGVVTSGATVSRVYTDAGFYNVTLTVTDDDSLQDQESDVITVTEEGTGGGTASWRHLSASSGDLPPPGGNAPDQTVALVFDVNGNGVNDFVIGTRLGSVGPCLEWWQRTSSGWTRHLIEPDRLPLEAGGAFHDIDGDGDRDLVVGEDGTSNRLYWWENPSPDFGGRWVRREIKNAPGRQHHDQAFGDFDGDGAVELAYWNNLQDNSLWISEIPSDPTIEPWPRTLVFNAPSRSEGLVAADIDGDGVDDIVGGGYWFKFDGSGGYAANEIDSSMRFTRVAVGQFIAGGHPEVVFDSGDDPGPLRLYSWSGSGWTGLDLLDEPSQNGHSLNVGDVNGDGNLDIMSAEMFIGGNTSPQLRVLYGNGSGQFEIDEVEVGIGNHESKLADLDGDGDLDILGKPFRQNVPELHIWLNEGGEVPTESWQRHVIDDAVPYRTIFVEHGDINGDGLEDVIAGGWWWRNPGTAEGNWTRNRVPAPMNQMAAVYDFDRDGDLDILGTAATGSSSNSTLHWGQNNGSGGFTVRSNIEPAIGDFLQGVTVAEFQPGTIEIALSWERGDGGLQMVTVPSPASITTATWQWRQAFSVVAGEGLDNGDIDGDGDLDILDGQAWYRNDGGVFRRFTLSDAASGLPDRNLLADIDRDGDLDAVIGFGHDPDGKIAWYEQGPDPTTIWTQHLVDAVGPAQPQSVDVADFDGDGDSEIVVGEHSNPITPGLRLQIYEQQGSGLWTPRMIHAGDEHHDGAQVVDIDNDGDLDVISIGWLHRRLLVYENQTVD